MDFKFTILPTDILLYLLVVAIIIFIFWARKNEQWRMPWCQVLSNKLGMIAMVILSGYVVIGLLDSIHFRPELTSNNNAQEKYYAIQVRSLLDLMLGKLSQTNEVSYSAPFALQSYSKDLIELPDGKFTRGYTRLNYVNKDIQTNAQRDQNILLKIIKGFILALFIWLILSSVLIFYLAKHHRNNFLSYLKLLLQGQTNVAWREILITIAILLQLICIGGFLAAAYHVFGTDKVGQDVFYETLKSIRTGLIIGTLTTLIMLPFAVFFGTVAGYFGGKIDDVIQYVYTTLSSIPAVLLITAAILSLQIFIENHPEYFSTLAIRADIRLLALCAILGITSWTSLCRLLRAETLKLREIDFVAAAKTLGTSNYKIILQHILPNVMHIILITVVLDFSALVLAEAVLSYVGVGVDPTTQSWGNMINSARLELAREPVVWWPLTAAFIFMSGLVLSANIFADQVRDAFDPKLRKREVELVVE